MSCCCVMLIMHFWNFWSPMMMVQCSLHAEWNKPKKECWLIFLMHLRVGYWTLSEYTVRFINQIQNWTNFFKLFGYCNQFQVWRLAGTQRNCRGRHTRDWGRSLVLELGIQAEYHSLLQELARRVTIIAQRWTRRYIVLGRASIQRMARYVPVSFPHCSQGVQPEWSGWGWKLSCISIKCWIFVSVERCVVFPKYAFVVHKWQLSVP